MTPIFNACVVEYVDDSKLGIKKYGVNPYNYKCLTMWKILEEQVGKEVIEWTAANEQEAEAASMALTLFPSKVAIALYKRQLRLEGPLVKCANPSLDFLPLLLPLFRLTGFPEAWDAYLEVPDDGCGINSDDDKTQVEMSGKLLAYPDLTADAKKTHSDMEFVTLMAIICISKNMVNSEQFDNVVKARSSGLSHALSARGLTEDRAKKLVNYDAYNALSHDLAFFPKMRSMIYRHILFVVTGAPTVKYVKPLLKDSQMTVYKLITLFVFSEEKTKAHILDIITKEMLAFLESYKIVTDRYGIEHWEYAKLLSSVEQETSTPNFPMLVTAALYFMYLRTGSATYQNLKVKHGRSKAIAQAVATPLLANYVSVAPQSLAKEILKVDEELLKKLGLKWAEIERDGIDKVCGKPNEDYIN